MGIERNISTNIGYNIFDHHLWSILSPIASPISANASSIRPDGELSIILGAVVMTSIIPRLSF